ncbi:MAG: NADH:ubiquinone oxidoreductase subunit NDUFA12 [Alphaproteobacteria bacterium]|nr:NADH:ubiquinone oxidoreductase subunit NDUFA12 [Alphaproteobacteria bacterium]
MSKLITRLCTFLTGKKIGEDAFGNLYYISRKESSFKNNTSLKKEKRWVVFKDEVEASKIPPLWHAWLHFTSDEIPDSKKQTQLYTWQKPYLPNLTGTPYAYRPKGHTLVGGKRAKATGDYEPWTPE